MTSIASPAAQFARDNQWLTKGDHTPVVEVKPTSPTSVDIVVQDGWAEPGDDATEMHHLVADHARGLLEQTVDGVKVNVRAVDGYVGEGSVPSPDEQYFATSIPGVTYQFTQVENDNNGDGHVADDELAWQFSVDSEASKARIDKLVVDKYGWDRNEPVLYTIEG